jgi:hypothetical protein
MILNHLMAKKPKAHQVVYYNFNQYHGKDDQKVIRLYMILTHLMAKKPKGPHIVH